MDWQRGKDYIDKLKHVTANEAKTNEKLKDASHVNHVHIRALEKLIKVASSRSHRPRATPAPSPPLLFFFFFPLVARCCASGVRYFC